MLKNFNFTNDEESLITCAETGNTGKINQSRIIATLILTKQLKQSTEQLIESNSLLAKAEDKNSKKMQYLTWVLIGVGALQATSMLIDSLFKYCIK